MTAQEARELTATSRKNKTLEFLKSKHMLQEGEQTYPINGPRGSVDLVELLTEYKYQEAESQPVESTKKQPQSKSPKK